MKQQNKSLTLIVWFLPVLLAACAGEQANQKYDDGMNRSSEVVAENKLKQVGCSFEGKASVVSISCSRSKTSLQSYQQKVEIMRYNFAFNRWSSLASVKMPNGHAMNSETIDSLFAKGMASYNVVRSMPRKNLFGFMDFAKIPMQDGGLDSQVSFLSILVSISMDTCALFEITGDRAVVNLAYSKSTKAELLSALTSVTENIDKLDAVSESHYAQIVSQVSKM